MKTERLGDNQIGLVMQVEDRIIQIGLTESQSRLLQAFLGELSKDSPLCQMGKEYDLVLKSEVHSMKRKK